jgi:hypothetical protein
LRGHLGGGRYGCGEGGRGELLRDRYEVRGLLTAYCGLGGEVNGWLRTGEECAVLTNVPLEFV